MDERKRDNRVGGVLCPSATNSTSLRRSMRGTRLWLAAVAILVFGAALWAAASRPIPQDPIEAHRLADGVLYPELVAAMNDFTSQHGRPNDLGHFHKFQADDVERIKLVRQKFAEWSRVMEQAGY
jgi:hypothetical protein